MKAWKKTVILFMVVLLAVASVPMTVSATSATKNEIDKTEKEKDNLQNELDKTQENLDALEGQRDTLEKELAYLNGQLTAVAAELADLETQIREKEQEIEDTQAALDEAKKTEEWQYNSMVAIVRCMFEQQEDNYLATLFSVGSFSELLNKADYIEKTVAYEQKMLKEYKENRKIGRAHV